LFFIFLKKMGKKRAICSAGGLKSRGEKSAPVMKNHPPATEQFSRTGEPSFFHEWVNLHAMPSFDPPIADGDDVPPIAADAPPIAADAPPITAGAADDAASDEDSLSSEVSRRDSEGALTSEALRRAVDGAVDVDEGADDVNAPG
jgi:hypothetical protein